MADAGDDGGPEEASHSGVAESAAVIRVGKEIGDAVETAPERSERSGQRFPLSLRRIRPGQGCWRRVLIKMAKWISRWLRSRCLRR